MTKLRATITGCVLLLATAGLAGCGSYGGICEAAGDCVGGNELDVENCINEFDTEAEVASIYGCDEEWDLLVTCMEEEGSCNDDEYVAEGCDDEAEDYDECTD